MHKTSRGKPGDEPRYGQRASLSIYLCIRKVKNEATINGSVGIPHYLRMSLCISVVLLVMFTTTWVFGLLAVYGNDFSSTVSQSSEYAFAILYATMGVFVFIVMCLNSKVSHFTPVMGPPTLLKWLDLFCQSDSLKHSCAHVVSAKRLTSKIFISCSDGGLHGQNISHSLLAHSCA